MYVTMYNVWGYGAPLIHVHIKRKSAKLMKIDAAKIDAAIDSYRLEATIKHKR